jgi:ribose 5-phosphate isomerase A
MQVEELKKAVAEKAVEQVKSGMVLGLGTGSTTRFAIIKIGELWQAGELTDVVGIPTSEGSASLARQYGIPLTTLFENPVIDLAIDGADEVDPHFNVIKGLGAALLREKMVELTARHFIVVVDERKVSRRLGLVSPLPLEVTQFGWRHQARWLTEHINCTPVLRGGEANPVITDNGNYLLDCTFTDGISDPAALALELQARPGIVEHGLFLGMAHEILVATSNGTIERMVKT